MGWAATCLVCNHFRKFIIILVPSPSDIYCVRLGCKNSWLLLDYPPTCFENSMDPLNVDVIIAQAAIMDNHEQSILINSHSCNFDENQKNSCHHYETESSGIFLFFIK